MSFLQCLPLPRWEGRSGNHGISHAGKDPKGETPEAWSCRNQRCHSSAGRCWGSPQAARARWKPAGKPRLGAALGAVPSFLSSRAHRQLTAADTRGRALPDARWGLAEEAAFTGIEGKNDQRNDQSALRAANRACCRAGPEGPLPKELLYLPNGAAITDTTGLCGLSADRQRDAETSPTCKCGAQRFAYEIKRGPQRPQPYLGTAARCRRY